MNLIMDLIMSFIANWAINLMINSQVESNSNNAFPTTNFIDFHSGKIIHTE